MRTNTFVSGACRDADVSHWVVQRNIRMQTVRGLPAHLHVSSEDLARATRLLVNLHASQLWLRSKLGPAADHEPPLLAHLQTTLHIVDICTT